MQNDQPTASQCADDEEEIRAINEKLVIAGVRQQEYADIAQDEKQKEMAAHEQLKHLHESLQAAHKALEAAYEREHRIAQALQRPLTVEVPEDAFPGLSVTTLYTAAWDEAEVGGDFYDAIPLSDGRVAFVVGDASGKGLAAAARATEVKDALRAYLRLYPFYPGLTLTRLSDYLCDAQKLDDRARDTFIALCLVIVSVRESEAIFAWAGIEAPILMRAGGAVERLAGAAPPLGVFPERHYMDTMVQFRPGDTLMLSTDGLSEARSGTEFFGEAGVNVLAERSRAEPTLRDMGTAILAGARAYAGGRLTDDACLVLVRRR